MMSEMIFMRNIFDKRRSNIVRNFLITKRSSCEGSVLKRMECNVLKWFEG